MTTTRVSSGPSSAMYGPVEMSVVLESKMDPGRDLASALGEFTDHFLAATTTEQARCEEEQAIAHTPTADEPAHGDVCGKKSKTRRGRFAKKAEWAIGPPEGFEPPKGD